VAADQHQPHVPADVVAQATAAFGGIDVLINNAGNVRAGRIDSITEDEITAQLQLNLTAPILLTRAALPALRASAMLAAIADDEISVVRGGSERSAMIAANRDDPASVDEKLAGMKADLERAVSEHSSI